VKSDEVVATLCSRALFYSHTHRNNVPGEVVARALKDPELCEAIQSLRASDAAIANPSPKALQLVLMHDKPHPLRHGHIGRFNRR
jgi:tRNA pseudouridine-54 N-methylase